MSASCLLLAMSVAVACVAATVAALCLVQINRERPPGPPPDDSDL
jgi:hypothetical protein